MTPHQGPAGPLADCAQIIQGIGIRDSEELVARLCAEARQSMRADLASAATYSAAAYAVARRLKKPGPLSEALKMRGHVAYLGGKHRQAAAAYRKAIAILESIGAEVEAGRTRSSAIQTLMYLGCYEEALSSATRARDIFERHGDHLRLARLDANIANVLHRQDRLQEALAKYQAAIREFGRLDDTDSLAITMRNLAVCLMDLHDVGGALSAYQQARSHCEALGQKLLTAEIDDNIAYLHYLTGDYTRALTLYQEGTRQESPNLHHVAVCLLDQSDLYLELNLFPEAAQMASDASERFAKLGMRFERGKALVNYGMALSGMGSVREAARVFRRGRLLLSREQAQAWTSIADLHQAAMLRADGDLKGARTLASLALDGLAASQLDSRKAAAALVLADIDLAAGLPAEAGIWCERARDWLAAGASHSLSVLLTATEGRVAEALGEMEKARSSYTKACAMIESARGRLPFDQLRYAFLRNRDNVYQALVRFSLLDGDPRHTLRYVEQAKSRSLSDALSPAFFGAQEVAPHRGDQEALSLRRRLTWLYHQQERVETEKASPSGTRLASIRKEVQACERRLMSAWTASLPVATAERAAPADIETALAQLQADSGLRGVMLEYFESSGEAHAAVITSSEIVIKPLCHLSEIHRSLRFLSLQLSRGSAGSFAPAPDDQEWLTAATCHLAQLYDLLIAPLQRWLPSGDLTIVPHGPMHGIPFAALFDGESYLADRVTLSVAPSAAIQALCNRRNATAAGPPAIFGVADERAPLIAAECQAVARALGSSQLEMGAHSTLSRFAEACPSAMALHLASHGTYRRDNPSFSSIRLADGRLCLHDLYRLTIGARLVTLSGCSTGLHEAIAGDETIGLVRGFLVAGAGAVQVTLWDVNDRSTAIYMEHFYQALRLGSSIAGASRSAMLSLRSQFPHPYFWAPFYVTGRTSIGLPIFPATAGVPNRIGST